MAPPRTPKLLLSACLLCLATACGVDVRESTAAFGTDSGGSAGAPAKPATAPVAGELQFGAEHRFTSGITVSVSAPGSFQPSAAAYPRSPRAASFAVEVRNDGSDTYRLSGLAITAAIGGQQAKQVVDATQGLGGITDAGKDLLPGRSAQFTIAFAVPAQAARLELWLRPSASEPAVVSYGGTA
ncbi:hypothetical protein ATK36_4944 [Amycolatopsis sulphurea]|uniref:DUF4352 domain-containing protein n=1 Tax=Amycolatopsis sulphurea TaxID=76022 RepID=A0A2A9FE86_9PSEU|nr:hypothetical protein [Amycolatopsis sulphurea]PFG49767.1 hypothetical protein ATK36_4944 [Amycolatopsis sulphurea]